MMTSTQHQCNTKMPLLLTCEMAQSDERYWSLINFFIGSGNHVPHWQWIQTQYYIQADKPVELFRGLYFEAEEECNTFIRTLTKDGGYTSSNCSHWSESRTIAELVSKWEGTCSVVISALFDSSHIVFRHSQLGASWKYGIGGQATLQKEIVIRPLESHPVMILSVRHHGGTETLP
jgi:hypothetical protein